MLTWNENYLMGVEELDEDHRQLFKLAQQVLERTKTREEDPFNRMFILREGMNYLQGYFARHTAREEAYMRRTGYPGYAIHKMQHEEFLSTQMAKYRKVVESGKCSKEEVREFVGSGVGWLLDHIATADMAIVGKGVLSRHIESRSEASALEEGVNTLLAATLNLEANAKIINRRYVGEPFGKAICQKILYEKQGQRIAVVSGIERSFVLYVANQLYGDNMEDEMDLVLSTVEMFGAQFWLSLIQQMTGSTSKIEILENHFLVGQSLHEELRQLHPTLSVLFTSDRGKFFLASDRRECFLPQAAEA